jgi:NNP family nitrate/nitrite transporter-like MFS transporter
MQDQGRATALWANFFHLSMPQMRAFHMTWFAFFLCFFAWFGIAPLMKVVREDLQLTQSQIGWSIIASVAITVVARLVIGWLCDRIGPRLAYTWLLVVGSIPVMLIGLSRDPYTFIFFRLLIGVIGASFVITQYHTSVMFAPNVVGTANATSAGWGNLGGGATQLVMPLVFGLCVSALACSAAWGWRLSMVLAGAICLATGLAYYRFTQDTPEGNFQELRAAGRMPDRKQSDGAFWEACRDRRVWALFLIYGACFGIELTINNVAALYFLDYFDYFQQLDSVTALRTAGLIAGLFGLMNLFARTLGGVVGDGFGARWGLQGRVTWLFMALFCEGLALMLFSQMNVLVLAIPALILFSLFVQMSEGATYSVVPFISRRGLGAVAGIVGAGGNAGAVAAGFLFKGGLPWPTALLLLGGAVTACSFAAFAVTFSPHAETEARRELARAMARSRRAAGEPEQGEPELQPA